MDDLALLTILDSFHKMTDSINSSPSTTTAYMISAISGIVGVIVGFAIQWYKEVVNSKNKIKEAQKLITFELDNLRRDAVLAIKASSYLLDSYPIRDTSKFHVLNPAQRKFYDDFFSQVALGLDENRRQSIIIAYSHMFEYNSDIHFLDKLAGRKDDEILYHYEYMMWLATATYLHAKNGLSSSPVEYSQVKIDHAKAAIDLNCKCIYLETNRQITMTST